MSTIPIVRSRFVNPRVINSGTTIKIDAEFKADAEWPGKRLFGMNLRFAYGPQQFKWLGGACRIVDLPPQWYIGTESYPATVKPAKSSLNTYFNFGGGTVYVNTNIQGPLYEGHAAAAGVPLLDDWARYFSLEIDLQQPLQPGQTIFPMLVWDKTSGGERGMVLGDGLTESLVINPASPDRQYVDERSNQHLNWFQIPGNTAPPFGLPQQLTPVTY